MKSVLNILVFTAALATASVSQADSFDVYAQTNSSSGGVGLATIYLNAGEGFSTSASILDLWSAGALPRWSNADGLVGDLFATGSDESGTAVGTLIGQDFGAFSNGSFTAPYGALVGKIGSSYILLGTDFSGFAPEAGTLNLYYWDSNSGDNSNFVTVQVNSSVPDQGGIILSLMGALTLFSFRRFVRR